MRKLASIQKIISIKPIEKADAIEVAQVLGWECVVKKTDNFKVGDLVIYIEIDSIVPEKPEFEFLRERKFRIRTIKLRGQVSQGLVLPLSYLPKGNYLEGDDVTNLIGVKKYDPQYELEQKIVEEKLNRSKNKISKYLSKYNWFRNLFRFTLPKRDSFPKFIKKTDEDRIQLFPNICENEKETIFIETEKLDGQSGTYFLIKNPRRFLWFGEKYIFGVCSRNFVLPKSDNSSYWTIARQYNVRSALENLIGDSEFIIIQGEILGNGIQGNKYGIYGYDFFAFNLIYPNELVNSILAEELLLQQGIKFVPILNIGLRLCESITEMVEHAKGKSTIANVQREGVVIRNYNKNISFKVINPDFLLKYDN